MLWLLGVLHLLARHPCRVHAEMPKIDGLFLEIAIALVVQLVARKVLAVAILGNMLHLLVVRSLLMFILWHLHGFQVRWSKVRHSIIRSISMLVTDHMDNFGPHLVLRPHILAAPFSITATRVATFKGLVDLLPLSDVLFSLGVILKVR